MLADTLKQFDDQVKNYKKNTHKHARQYLLQSHLNDMKKQLDESHKIMAFNEEEIRKLRKNETT